MNLAADPNCAQMMVEGKNLQQLMSKAFKTRNPLLAKILKNVSRHDDDAADGKSGNENSSSKKSADKRKVVSVRKRFTDYVVEVAEQVKNAFKDAFAAECLGILANMTDPELDFQLVLKEYRLVEWLKDHLSPESIGNLDGPRDELALEVGSFVDEVAAARRSMSTTLVVIAIAVHL